MKNPSRDVTKYYKYVAAVLAVVLLVSAGFFLLGLWEKRQNKPIINPEAPHIEYEGKKYVLKEDLETFLVLGLDKFTGTSTSDSYNNDMQADFLMLFVFDNNAKTCSAIQINRDTMAKVDILGVAGERINTVTEQIALAHTYGNGKGVSCRNTADSVAKLLSGMRVNHYISVTMDAVPVYNDLLGGVELEILDDFTGIDTSLVKGTKVNLNGEQALTYVQSRYGLDDSTNGSRMKRQSQYVNALYNKSLERFKTDKEFIIESTLKMTEYIVSDRSLNQLQTLLEKFTDYDFMGIRNIDGESKLGEKYMEFYPDNKSIEKLVVELFYKLKD